jgi:hypothetical protein
MVSIAPNCVLECFQTPTLGIAWLKERFLSGDLRWKEASVSPIVAQAA